MRVACEWTEEELIDLILSHERESPLWRRFEAHLPFCKHCRFLYEYWEGILSDPNEPPDQSIEKSDLSSEGKDFASERELWKPSHRVKDHIYETLFPKRRLFKQNKRVLIFSATAFSTFLFLVGLTSLQPQPAGEKTVPAIIPRQTLENYQVIPVSQGVVNGTIWLNRENDDMMLFLKGVKPIVDHDYQVWMMTQAKQPLNGGLLNFSQGSAQLKIHGPSLSQVQTLMISLEPSGGSQNPTGPRTVTIDLKK